MDYTNHVVYYEGHRVFPDYTSNVGYITPTIHPKYLKCKCGSIFQNRKASIQLHINCSKHQRYIVNNNPLNTIEPYRY